MDDLTCFIILLTVPFLYLEWCILDRLEREASEGRKAMLDLSIKTGVNLFRVIR